jgi:hypothetical protein
MEQLARMISNIVLALEGRVTWSALPQLLVAHVLNHFNRIKHRLLRTAALVRESKYDRETHEPAKASGHRREKATGA